MSGDLPSNLTLDLSGRTTIVTGGGQGLGRCISIAFAQLGANVVIATRRAETGQPVADEITAAGGSAILVVTDVAERGDVDHAVDVAVETYGGLDVMVHNALGRVGRARYGSRRSTSRSGTCCRARPCGRRRSARPPHTRTSCAARTAG